PGRTRGAFQERTECVRGGGEKGYFRTDPAHDEVRKIPLTAFFAQMFVSELERTFLLCQSSHIRLADGERWLSVPCLCIFAVPREGAIELCDGSSIHVKWAG